MVAAAVITARIILRTVRGCIPGGRPKTNTRTASPIPATAPRAIPPNRDPTKMEASTTRSSSQIISDTALSPTGSGHQSRIKHIVNLLLRQQLLLSPQFDNPLARLQGFGREFGRYVVPQQWIQGGDNSDAMLHIAAANLVIRRNATDTVLSQSLGGVHEHGLRLENAISNNRLHNVELQLAGFCGQCHRKVIRDDLEADLIHYFGDHGIDFARHDA